MNNLDAYNNSQTVDYYGSFDDYGLFAFERKIIDKYFVGKKVIDIGCGTGRTTYPLYNIGFDVVGVDYAKGMIDKAREKHPQVLFEVGDCLDLKYPDNMFDDALFSFNGIMLEKDYDKRVRMLEEIYRVLKQGGVLFFTTPYLDNKVNKGYWKEKINNEHIDLSNSNDRMRLGEEITDEDGVEFYIHIPFCDEVEIMIDKVGFKCICKGSRLDDFGEETAEDELDDNYYWVVRR